MKLRDRQKYRILHIITRLDKGGSAENTLLTAMGLDKSRYEVSILCGVSDNPPSQNEEAVLKQGIRIFRNQHLVRDISLFRDFRAFWAIYFLVNRNRYDLVHTHSSKAGFIGRVAAKFGGVKRIVHTPHGNIFHGYFSAFGSKVFIWFERFCMVFTDILIALTQRGKQEHLDVGIGRDERIRVVTSGIELDPFQNVDVDRQQKRAEIGINADWFAVGTVARLVSIKNHTLIVSAAKQCVAQKPDIHFVFAGDGSLRKELEDQVAAEKIGSNVHFLGWRNDTPELLHAFDLFVMPSMNEGLGRAFVEAQGAGVPVIGSRVGGIPDVIKEGETGLLVDPGNRKELADAILSLYYDRGRLKRMSQACKAWVDPQFRAKTMVEALDKIYMELLEGK